MEPLTGAFHDAITGETIVRELTNEELKSIPQTPGEADDASEPA